MGKQKADKNKILDAFLRELERELNTLIEAAFEAKEAATSEEARAENEYDTRGLEASYLAGAQSKRAGELRDFINQLKKIKIRSYRESDEIEATALIEIEIDGEEKKWFFMVPQEGGAKVTIDGLSILLISPESPLGQEIYGKRVGDAFEFETRGQLREYEIISVC